MKQISVSKETEERIRAEARRLGYRPNANARNLRLRRTEALGLILPSITNPTNAEIVRGAVRRASVDDIAVLLIEASDNIEAALDGKLVTEHRVDGLMITLPRNISSSSRVLQELGVPHVLAGHKHRGSTVPSITVDDEASGALAAHTLISAGHRRLAVVSGPPEALVSERRLAGFRSELRRSRIQPPAVHEADFTAAGGFDAMLRALRAHPRPTGVFVTNFVASLGALSAASQLGVRIPDEVSIIGYDGGEITGYTVPPLTAVQQPFEAMGAAAVETLLTVINGGVAKDVVIKDPAPVIVNRGSVAPPSD